MTPTRPRRVARLACVGALALTTVLGACSSDESSDTPAAGPADSASATASDSATASPGADPTAYLPVPAGISLTAQGATLGLGDKATLAWTPRQGVVGVVELTVKRLQKASYRRDFVGWDIPASERSSQPYFVRGVVRNTGATDVGRRDVPLYVADQSDLLIEASGFKSTFTPCPGGKFFPRIFEPGDVANLCLVFLVPNRGELSSVSFRPTEDFTPITWTGEVVPTVSETGTKGGKGGKGTKGGTGTNGGTGTKGATATASP